MYHNWLLAGTDAHRKNYALLLAAAGQVRLAPLYDIASVLPYRDLDIERARSSMKIGNEYRLRNIGKCQRRKLAQTIHIDPVRVVGRIGERPQLTIIPEITKRMKKEGLDHPSSTAWIKS